MKIKQNFEKVEHFPPSLNIFLEIGGEIWNRGENIIAWWGMDAPGWVEIDSSLNKNLIVKIN